jgi:tryptophan synthase alpha chain
MSKILLETTLKKSKQIIPYFTYGDISEGFTFNLICNTFDQGIDIIEIGFPFTDPIADGPVIQESHQRALIQNPNLSLASLFQMTNRIKQIYPNKHLIIMIAINLVLQFNPYTFFEYASKNGISGVIIPDLNIETATPFKSYSKTFKVALINLVSPLCKPERLNQIIQNTSGFIYLISSLGTTGERASFSNRLHSLVNEINQIKHIPVGIGFGISEPNHIRELSKIANALIIGSHLISIISKYKNNPQNAINAVSQRIGEFLKCL